MLPIQWPPFTYKRYANGKTQSFAYVYELCHSHINKATDKTGMEKDMGYPVSRAGDSSVKDYVQSIIGVAE